MNLAYKYPIIFWNCACLINDSGGNDEEEELEEDLDSNEEDSEEDLEEEEESSEKKKKTKTTNYGKIATAIGSMLHAGISVSPPDINKSSYTFIPDVDKNTIIYGIKGINKIGDNLVKEIISNRPYASLNDFIHKVKINKPQMISLIKSGALDNFGESREDVMFKYIDSIVERKERLTLQNMNMLIEKEMIPEELSQEVKTYNFNKYLKKHKVDDNYLLDEIAYPYYANNFDLDNLWYDNNYYINQKVWDKIYTKAMDPVRNYINKNKKEMLETLNNKLFKELWDKYCLGSTSKWEMDSISFYYGTHELSDIDIYEYEINYYSSLSNTPEIDYIFKKDGKDIPIYKLYRIAGTVLDKNKNKNTVTLLTTDGVVNVKIYQAQFAKYNKQISMKMPDGKKKVLEKSWFSRGNKLIFTGIRRDDMFIPKKYKNTKYSVIELITNINEDGSIETTDERREE